MFYTYSLNEKVLYPSLPPSLDCMFFITFSLFPPFISSFSILFLGLITTALVARPLHMVGLLLSDVFLAHQFLQVKMVLTLSLN